MHILHLQVGLSTRPRAHSRSTFGQDPFKDRRAGLAPGEVKPAVVDLLGSSTGGRQNQFQ